MNVLALDLSLTSTGVAHPDGSVGLWKPPGKMVGVSRLEWFQSMLWDATSDEENGNRVDLVVIEDYAFSAIGRQHATGELGGVIRLALHKAEVPWTAVGIKSLKSYATGRGNASKEEMKAAARARLGYGGESDDEADACWLRAMALDAYGAPVCAMPAKQRGAMSKVAWPAVTGYTVCEVAA